MFQAQKEMKKEMDRVSKLLLGNARRNDAVTVYTRLAKKGSLLFQHTDKEKRGGGENDIQSRST